MHNPDVSSAEELVVLCGPAGDFAGTAPKAGVHHHDTPLHLAFSCYLFDDHGRVLVTRRAAAKPTWPDVRTNSCCGHPAPGEPMTAAIRRRLRDELGVVPDSVELVLPKFRYQAQMADGTMENELCPVYRARLSTTTVAPAPAEVSAVWWQDWIEFTTSNDPADPLSPWSLSQISGLDRVGPKALDWPVADPRLLPAAAVA